MTARTARPLAATAAAALAFGGLALAGAPAAFAAPGDNGDVKIHKVGTPFDDQSNEPKVCKFYLAAFNFDSLQEVDWEITPQPPKADDPSLSGHITLGGTGKGHTGPLSLPSGQYKLVWTFEGENGAGKQKVFKVECPGDVITNPTNPPTTGGHGPGKPPHGPVGAGGGGSAELAAEDSSAFGVGAAVAAGLAGTAGLVLIRRSRRRDNGAA
ncbi:MULTISPECIES: hypothetical protein [Streptomyces]|uniref:Gram-positive cocci surface proteins LPxTG domain-containing protein n=1 Tax=Streptomyces venezuelae (strain ATCC 10712 / CBS 650.69 / DSM 40230 / JCM 4526 / NBRC 13096 / PD 04745) TaxID=953739 RepID=F2RE71_STRVP|nr:hypothetical protein [Streptomyces venezuelae]APE20690.1 hypothetical protein vnz_06480 [Streptomyces venezuelae]QER98080.1 hypothetical protein DEJ43_06540 [Streptomyces venezuelae ATCC 10712]QES05279.1 hypothetical protein DEJ44_06405 [Streptomyces venezuelae]CCA54611.1 hypothetical protein SVEN_1324 [Streptomyces venezuelae ATCC 10712]